MILNDALYLINAGRDGTPFSEIIVQGDDYLVSVEGRKIVDLIAKDVDETKELLRNELTELGASMGEEDEEEYVAEWAAAYEKISLLEDKIDCELSDVNIESVTYSESLMYIILEN